MAVSSSPYARATLAVSLVLGGVYVLNLLYLRAVSDGTLSIIAGFDGIGNVYQAVMLLIMSAFFAATIMLRADG
jgi:hypothetical protein